MAERRNEGQRNEGGGVVRRDEAGAILEFLPRMSPRTYSAVMGWAVCIYLLLLASPPASTPAALAMHGELMRAAAYDPLAMQIEADVSMLMRERDVHKVLFWSWREPYATLVRQRQAEIDERLPELHLARAESERLRVKARQAVGLWSEIGVGEVRGLFWKSWQEGKDFAKRMTFWDVMFAATSSRREEATALAVAVRLASQFLMNLSVGLISAVLWFSARAVSLVFAYQPPVLTGVAFSVVAVLGAAGTVALFLALLYSAAVGSVYLVVRQAALQRIEAQRQAQMLRQQQGGFGRQQTGDGDGAGGPNRRGRQGEHYD